MISESVQIARTRSILADLFARVLETPTVPLDLEKIAGAVTLSAEEHQRVLALLGKEESDLRESKAVRRADGAMYVLSPVLVPEKEDGQGDVMSAGEIQNAARQWLAHSQTVSLMHRRTLSRNRVQIVESYTTREPQTFGKRQLPAGTWMLGLHVHDEELKAAIRAKRLRGLSMGGRGERNPA